MGYACLKKKKKHYIILRCVVLLKCFLSLSLSLLYISTVDRPNNNYTKKITIFHKTSETQILYRIFRGAGQQRDGTEATSEKLKKTNGVFHAVFNKINDSSPLRCQQSPPVPHTTPVVKDSLFSL